jgi:hypothetical protein
MLEELEQAAEALQIKVIYERLSPEASPGGLCRVQGEYRVMIDRHLPVLERVNVLVGALARFSTEGLYLSPELRDRLGQRAAELQAETAPGEESEKKAAVVRGNGRNPGSANGPAENDGKETGSGAPEAEAADNEENERKQE